MIHACIDLRRGFVSKYCKKVVKIKSKQWQAPFNTTTVVQFGAKQLSASA
jgi:hypothetical protein